MTLANRDQIFGDDNVQILLGTFHDGKQALMFAVNPLGVQGDGSLIEGANVTASGFIGSAVVGREQPDLSPDFVFQSRGRVTDWGYEVEVRIPFKSIRYDPRQALFFSTKRPFFLEGSELSQVPQGLIYTRRIVQPVAAVKLSGTTFGTDIGLLSAVDQAFASATGTDNPVFTILRAQKSLGRASRLGLAYTDWIEGGDYNRVAELDSRLIFKEIYGLNLQLAGSRPRVGGVTTTAPLWLSQFTVQHRIWGLRSLFAGIS